jgi:hypothetical protein
MATICRLAWLVNKFNKLKDQIDLVTETNYIVLKNEKKRRRRRRSIDNRFFARFINKFTFLFINCENFVSPTLLRILDSKVSCCSNRLAKITLLISKLNTICFE